MRWFRQSTVGILGDLLLILPFLPRFLEWVLELQIIRVGLGMANLGQAVDFAIQHLENPGWLGNGWVQLAAIAVGFTFIFWDRKRPSWLPSPELSSRQMIIGGLIIIVLGVAVVGIGLWRSSPPLDVAKPISTGPSQSEVSDLQQKLAAAQQELAQRQAALNDANQQRDVANQEANALRQKVSPPPQFVDPMAPPPPKIPYQDGPILKRTYVDDEPKTVINALRELTQLAIGMQRDIQISQELTMRRRAGSGNQSPQNWAQALVKYGYDNVSKQLNEIGNKAKDYNEKINGIIAKPENDYFGADLYRIVGQTGLQELQSAAGAYVYYIQVLQKKNIPETTDNLDLISPILNEAVRSFEQASVNFRYWNNSFLNQRAPTAREQLEKLLPKAAQ